MAGNKFRKFREEEKSEANNIERNSNVMLTKNYSILLKAKEEQKYRSSYHFKEGTIVNVLDIINYMGLMYLKITMKKNDIAFGYIKVKDNEGNNNIKKN